MTCSDPQTWFWLNLNGRVACVAAPAAVGQLAEQ
jgi:hypothetical protein